MGSLDQCTDDTALYNIACNTDTNPEMTSIRDKAALSVKINSAALITEMVFGDLSGADLVFTFRKPEDLTLQDRFLVEIMKNNPDRAIREHVRQELLRCNTSIPGTDLTEPDPLFKEK